MAVLPGLSSMCGLGSTYPEVSYTSVTSDITDATTYTFSGVGIGAEAGDRLVVVAVAISFQNNSTAITSASIGGIAATINVQSVVTNSGYNKYVAIISAVVPTGTTATIVLNTNLTARRVGISVYRLTGLRSITPTQVASNRTEASATIATNVAVEAGGVAIAITANGDNGVAGGSITWTGINEDNDFSVESTFHYQSSASIQLAVANPSLALTAVAASPARHCAIAAASWR